MANEGIKGEAYQLKDVLATKLGSYYQIPDYQRPYQWTEENCEKLLDDLFFSYECYTESDYFCGSLVLIATDKDRMTNAETYDIVDGQQRLSTFILLAKVLVTLYDKDLTPTSRGFLEDSLCDPDGEKRKRLDFNTIGSNAKKDFQNALKFLDDPNASNGKDSTKVKNNYLKNAICLENYLRKKEIEDINAFIKWLYHKVIFIKTTCPNISMALRIFSVLNARGLPLHAIDVFKVELLKKLAKEKDQEGFVSRWNDLYQKCLDNELKILKDLEKKKKGKEKKQDRNAAETLFSWYLDYLNPVTGSKKMEERLADQFEKLDKTPLEYLKSVEDFYNAYCKILEMPDRYAHLLSYVATDSWRVILCASLLHRYSDQDIEDLKKMLVKFYYQNWVAGKTQSQIGQTCYNIIKALKEKKSIKEDINSIIKEYLDKNKIMKTFNENLIGNLDKKLSTKNSWLKPILILVEYFISDDDCPKRIQMDENLHVEHILPKKPNLSSQWAKDFDNEEERKLYTHSLANLTLLGGDKNKQASNLDFKDKKKIYIGEEIRLNKKRTFKVMTCYNMTKDIAYSYTEWTPKSLEKRKEELIKIIEVVLTL
ncbi:DUF262 domain-containing protein [Helicobacter pylori]|uniref:DUF262 domain-containing protein n=1 Tax=Helicobacter pylori TaxID=210 RepID=UPI00112A8B1F|nr:DUF262 domain-containing protein [Helicobacter pylori]TPH78513.1 DUF262 domain-containing protein [Helicobacter pylori]